MRFFESDCVVTVLVFTLMLFLCFLTIDPAYYCLVINVCTISHVRCRMHTVFPILFFSLAKMFHFNNPATTDTLSRFLEDSV